MPGASEINPTVINLIIHITRVLKLFADNKMWYWSELLHSVCRAM